MPIHTKYPPTYSTVSRDISPGEYSWDTVVYQSGKPVLDSDVNLTQDVPAYAHQVVNNVTVPSGFMRGQTRQDPLNDYLFTNPTSPTFVSNAFNLRRLVANVAGMPVVVEYTGTSTSNDNQISLDGPDKIFASPGSIRRTDFVFLEVWRAYVAPSPRAFGTITVADPVTLADGDTVTVDGTALTARLAPGLPTEFLLDPASAINTAASLATVATAQVATITASAAGTTIVTVKATTPGVAGNAITLATSNPAGAILSGATLSGGDDRPNKPSQNQIWRHGNVLSLGAEWLADNLADPTLDIESTERIQIQYRIRVTNDATGIDPFNTPNGYDNPLVLAQGATAAPVAGYQFVPADGVTNLPGFSSAPNYGFVDSGLYIAGDGTSTAATNLGTADGYVYSIPLCFVFRRNDAVTGGGTGFNPLTNANGAPLTTHAGYNNPNLGTLAPFAIPANESDRPDNLFADQIVRTDILDLRRHVSPLGQDLTAELQYQIQALLDGKLETWAIQGSHKNVIGTGSGDISTRFLVCNQIGRTATARGNKIRDFDHVARRFGDQSVTERVMFVILPTAKVGANPGLFVTPSAANPGRLNWMENDFITIDFAQLDASTNQSWDPATTTLAAAPSSYWPTVAGQTTIITDVLSVTHDDGNSAGAINKECFPKIIMGVGTSQIQIVLDSNNAAVNAGGSVAVPYILVATPGAVDNGSPRRIFVELEVTYVTGAGTTDTPDIILTPSSSGANYYATDVDLGAMVVEDVGQEPVEMNKPIRARYREGFREVVLEQVSDDGTGARIVETVVSDSTTVVRPSRRVYEDGSFVTYLPVVTDISGAPTGKTVDNANTEYGSSSRKVAIAGIALPFAQTLCQVDYFSQDPIPNYGAGAGYQISVYYRSSAPQTCGSDNLGVLNIPNPIVVEPLSVSPNVWTGQRGAGSVDEAFPYVMPLDQIPAADTSLFPGPNGGPQEWWFSGTSNVSIDDFNAGTGLLNLHSFVPMVGTENLTFQDPENDSSFRARYTVYDPNSYRPTVMSQPLSGIARHKVFFPVLARLVNGGGNNGDDPNHHFRKGELVLVVMTRTADLDKENTVRFVDAPNNVTVASIYRTRGMLLTVEGS